MDKTRETLLVRLRDRSDNAAWATFDQLYRSMLVEYSRSRGMDAADAEDIAQQCTHAVLEKIADYEHDASFKSWLRAIAEHKICDQFRRRGREVQPASGVLTNRPDSAPGLDELWDRHWAIAHLQHCAEIVRGEVSESTYAAFVGYAIEGRPAAVVAESLSLTVNQVYVSKHRVVERIRALIIELTGSDTVGFLP